MQIGIDVGATKIESVVLEDNGQESHRSRTPCPKDYTSIVSTIKDIHDKLQNEFSSLASQVTNDANSSTFANLFLGILANI